jgi:hypothetical protein
MKQTGSHAMAHRRAGARAALCLLLLVPSLPALAADPAAPPSYDVEVEVDLDAGSYRGRETVRVSNRTGGPIGELRFVLPPNLTVSAAHADGALAGLRRGERSVEVRLGRRLARGDSVDVALDFEGRAVSFTPEQVGLGAHVTDQVSIVLAPAEPRAREPRPTLTHSGDAMLLGTPFPVLSGPAEASAWRIAVTAPEGVDVVASGTPEGGGVFRGTGIRRAGLFVSRGYSRVEADAAGVRVRALATPVHAPAARRAVDALAAAVPVYAQAFGELPFREVTVVEAPLPPGTSSLAFSGLIAVASAYYADLRGPEARDVPGFIRDTPELTEGELDFAVMREGARQWWGEAVGLDAENEPFLAEGLAAYAAILAVERSRGAEAAAQAVDQRLRAPYRVYRMFGGQDAEARRRAVEFPNYFAYAAIVVSKGGLLLAALRKEVGDERFFEVLRKLYASHAGRSVRARDLVRAFEPAGERLHERWIEQRHGDEDVGAPEYAIAVAPDVASPPAGDDPKRKSAFERFGRLIVRKMVWFGKTAAKPF